MGQLILHKDGAYNLYSTVSDGCCYESALTLDQLRKVLRFQGGQRAVDELPARLERAHAMGCSSLDGMTLMDCIAGNRAGPDEAELTADEFIARYLTLPVSADDAGTAGIGAA
jgi:hypothetical protein